ncbi:MAG TPA: polysaccharide deacetylase family protein [Candidatus Polarisedimenticolaceae bacterium]|nr:polysaccharide deacetylase family protein [Candidatus Polarisedimenticolaceae bacterium]
MAWSACLPLLLAVLAPGPGTVAGSPRAVAVTFDDLPCNPQEGSTAAEQVAINRAIVDALDAGAIPAIGFVNEVRLYRDGVLDPARVAALTAWLEGGLTLGNHTFEHPSLHRTPLPAYLEGVVRGEEVTRGLLRARGQDLRWFRHPFLHTGRDLATRDQVVSFLAERGVRVAPVTIDNGEWIFARAYLAAAPAEKGRIADAYVAYMEQKTAYWERQSTALFGREIPQVLLVHANHLNADHFGRIAAMLRGRGYRFIALDEALRDPAYTSADRFTGGAGISWLHRWALTRGGPSRVLPDEPRTPPWVLTAAGVEEE